MKKKIILKTALWSCAALFVLTALLVVHIYLVTRYTRNDMRERQLSRIDFTEKVNPSEVVKIKNFVTSLDGVDGAFFNTDNGILVYSYAVGKQTSLNVYEQLMKSGNYKAHRYIVDETAAATGCPVIDKKSMSGRFTSYITKFMN